MLVLSSQVPHRKESESHTQARLAPELLHLFGPPQIKPTFHQQLTLAVILSSTNGERPDQRYAIQPKRRAFREELTRILFPAAFVLIDEGQIKGQISLGEEKISDAHASTADRFNNCPAG